MTRKLRIAVAVQGRFHAFDLVRALAARSDVDASLLTNYSGKECAAFGIDPAAVSSFVPHRWMQSICYRMIPQPMPQWLEAKLHQVFGRWACKRLEAMSPKVDVVRVFSGVAEEILRSTALADTVRLVTRGSAHIRTQRRLLEEESVRAGKPIDMPTDFMLAREEREYALANAVVVLSSFSKRTFIEQGYPENKLLFVPNAVNLKWYGARPDVMQSRRERILSGAPLRVLMVGSFSFQKGILDFAAAAEKLHGTCQFRFVGDVPPEGIAVREQLAGKAEFVDRVAPQDLPAEYAWGDVFLFPTVQDGFPAVLSQALAAGLPAITTPNGSGPDVVKEGVTGWCVPVRDPDAIVGRLLWLNANRAAAADMGAAAAASASDRSWDAVADDFVSAIRARWPNKCSS